jgi:alanine dehydrogenase
MHKEEGEKRDFTPSLFKRLFTLSEAKICLEKTYGSAMGFTENDYIEVHPNIEFVEHSEVYKKDMMIVLRAPTGAELDLMKRGAILISMLHYDTRLVRNEYLQKLGIKTFSMDSVIDDERVRMVVNYFGTSMGGASIAYDELKKRSPERVFNNSNPLQVSIIGFGEVGINAAKAFKNLSNDDMRSEASTYAGLCINLLTRSITTNQEHLEAVLGSTDILVDASWRHDSSQYIVKNELISKLPAHAILLDITADPYDVTIEPAQVKAIEGIPTGNLDKPVIEIDDAVYNTIPDFVDNKERRVVVSCDAWPGVNPIVSMDTYGKQLYPFIKLLLEKGPHNLDLESESRYERALERASMEYFEKLKLGHEHK